MFLKKDVDALYKKFSDKVYEPDALDGKTKELIALACSVMVDCIHCTEWHYKKAVEYRATEDEIQEALAITITVGAGSKKTKFKRIFDALKEKKQISLTDII